MSAYVESGRLWEVKNKRKLQTVIAKSGRGRLREVVAYGRFQLCYLTGEILIFWKSSRSRVL